MDTVTGYSFTYLNKLLNEALIGPANLGVYMRNIPQNVSPWTTGNVTKGNIDTGSMLDGTGDVISELWEPKKGRLLDIDYMISIMIMRKSEQQHCIKDLTGVPGFVYLLDNGRASFVMEKGAELYISGTLAKAHFFDKVKPQGKKQDISVIKEANEASCRTYLSLEKGKNNWSNIQ